MIRWLNIVISIQNLIYIPVSPDNWEKIKTNEIEKVAKVSQYCFACLFFFKKKNKEKELGFIAQRKFM